MDIRVPWKTLATPLDKLRVTWRTLKDSWKTYTRLLNDFCKTLKVIEFEIVYFFKLTFQREIVE